MKTFYDLFNLLVDLAELDEEDDPEEFLGSLLSSPRMNINIFEEKPDTSYIQLNGGTGVISLFASPEEMQKIVYLDVSDKNLVIQSDKELMYFIISEHTYINGEIKREFLQKSLVKKRININILPITDEIHKLVSLILYRPNITGETGRLLETESQINLKASYVEGPKLIYADDGENNHETDDTGTSTDTGSGSGTDTDTDTGTDTGTGTGTGTGTSTDTGTGTSTGTETSTDTGTGTETSTGSGSGSGTDTETSTNTGTGTDNSETTTDGTKTDDTNNSETNTNGNNSDHNNQNNNNSKPNSFKENETGSKTIMYIIIVSILIIIIVIAVGVICYLKKKPAQFSLSKQKIKENKLTLSFQTESSINDGNDQIKTVSIEDQLTKISNE